MVTIFVIFLSSAGLMMISDKGIHERQKYSITNFSQKRRCLLQPASQFN